MDKESNELAGLIADGLKDFELVDYDDSMPCADTNAVSMRDNIAERVSAALAVTPSHLRSLCGPPRVEIVVFDCCLRDDCHDYVVGIEVTIRCDQEDVRWGIACEPRGKHVCRRLAPNN